MPGPYAATLTYQLESVLQAAGDGYRLLIAPINVPSDDGRVIVGGLGARAGRLPLFFSDSEAGHDDAIHVGTFTDPVVTMIDDQQWLISESVEWDSDEQAQEARRLVDEGQFQGVSMHLGRGRFANVCPNSAGGFTEISDDDIAFDPETGDLSMPCDEPLLGAFDAEVAAVTIVGIPAFPGSKIEPESEVVGNMLIASGNRFEENTLPLPAGVSLIGPDGSSTTASTTPINVEVSGTWVGDPPPNPPWTYPPFAVPNWTPYVTTSPGTIQAAADPLDTPDPKWFTDPEFGAGGEDGRLVYDDRHDQWGCPLTVTDDGRIFGHLALWRTCHTGYRDRCVTAPKGADLAPFYQCRVTTADGETLPVGPLVVDEGHAPVAWSTDRVSRHYADTTLVAGYVRVGEDDHGIWVAGALSPRATPEMVDTLKRHSLSGDWRARDGRFELIAAVAVNSPGFPVPQVLVASGAEEPSGLITFGAPNPSEQVSELGLVAQALERMNRRLDDLEIIYRHLVPGSTHATVELGERVTVETQDENETDPAVSEVDESVTAYLVDEYLEAEAGLVD